MPRRPSPRQASAALQHLDRTESAALLSLLLQRHPELRAEAEALALNMLAHVDPEAVAEDVESAFQAIEQEDIWDRAGSSRYGYVEPCDAADEICEETLAPFLEELQRLLNLGLEEAALAQAKGVLTGLHRIQGRFPPDAEDYPAECGSGQVLEAWIEGSPQRSPHTLLTWVGEELPEWAVHMGRLAEMFGKRKG